MSANLWKVNTPLDNKPSLICEYSTLFVVYKLTKYATNDTNVKEVDIENGTFTVTVETSKSLTERVMF